MPAPAHGSPVSSGPAPSAGCGPRHLQQEIRRQLSLVNRKGPAAIPHDDHVLLGIGLSGRTIMKASICRPMTFVGTTMCTTHAMCMHRSTPHKLFHACILVQVLPIRPFSAALIACSPCRMLSQSCSTCRLSFRNSSTESRSGNTAVATTVSCKKTLTAQAVRCSSCWLMTSSCVWARVAGAAVWMCRPQ